MLTIRRLSSGYWHIRGAGPCEWAQPATWPCSEAELRASAFPEASKDFIREAMREARACAAEDSRWRCGACDRLIIVPPRPDGRAIAGVTCDNGHASVAMKREP